MCPSIRGRQILGEQSIVQQSIECVFQAFSFNRYPIGHYVRTLGPLGDKQTENEVLLIEHDVPHSKFSEEVLSCLPVMPWRISDQVCVESCTTNCDYQLYYRTSAIRKGTY